MDKFVLLACGNGLHMYKYHIDAGQKDDVKRSGQRSSEFGTCVKPFSNAFMKERHSLSCFEKVLPVIQFWFINGVAKNDKPAQTAYFCET